MIDVHTTSSVPKYNIYRRPLHLEIPRIAFYTDVSQTKRIAFEYFLPPETLIQNDFMYFETSDQTANGWISYIKEQFYSVPKVESIYYSIDDTDVDIWIIIPTRDFKLLRRLVDLEMKVLDIFSDTDLSLYRFEFHILYRNGANENQLVPKRALRLPK